MNFIEYWRARRMMKKLVEICADPRPTIEELEFMGETMRQSVLILQGKDPAGQAPAPADEKEE